MTMKKISKKIDKLVDLELSYANEQHPLFSSPHDAYGVIEEELRETEEALDVLRDHFELFFDKGVRLDDAKMSSLYLQAVCSEAKKVAGEAIQVAAMCEKYFLSNLKKDDNDE